jgi:hypothetical protein
MDAKERIAEIRREIHALYETGRRDDATLRKLQRLHHELTRLIEEGDDGYLD